MIKIIICSAFFLKEVKNIKTLQCVVDKPFKVREINLNGGLKLSDEFKTKTFPELQKQINWGYIPLGWTIPDCTPSAKK